MNKPQNLVTFTTIFGLLAFIMLATRTSHFGSAINLPDASLALFFLAGFYLQARPLNRTLAFFALCVLAVSIDYWAIAIKGTSSFCISSAYGFLLPTYFVMWWAGARSRTLVFHSAADWLLLIALSTTAVSIAFLLSNGSFYLFSGRFGELSFSDYLARAGLYYPRYAFYTLGYLALPFGLHMALTLPSLKKSISHD